LACKPYKGNGIKVTHSEKLALVADQGSQEIPPSKELTNTSSSVSESAPAWKNGEVFVPAVFKSKQKTSVLLYTGEKGTYGNNMANFN